MLAVSHPPLSSRRQTLAEIALIFAVFCVQGAWPVPGVNEPYYLGKAIHYWNPGWLAGDFFMESADTHKVFCFTFGWLSLWLPPAVLAWTGRAHHMAPAGLGVAAAELCGSAAAWYSVLTAALFACLMERFHMAGEWVIGGVEAKGFAYVFVFLAIESLVRNRWNRALLLFGGASAFHVLVGGWAAVATGLAWVWLRLSNRRDASAPAKGDAEWDAPAFADTKIGTVPPSAPPLASLWPGILGGVLLALPGVWPSLTLDWGASAETVQLAHQVYVFQRLPHHLTLTGIRPDFILRFALLTVFWLLLGHWTKRHFASPHARQEMPDDEQAAGLRRLRAFVGGAVVITLVGAALQPLVLIDRALAAGLFRYYWFRLTDVAIPLGVALEAVALLSNGVALADAPRVRRQAWSRGLLALAIVIAAFHLGDHAIDRIAPAPPRSNKMGDFDAWLAACQWVADSGKIPPRARFITPRLAETFGWYAHRSTVANWKDVPQDAQALVAWWDRVRDLYDTGRRPRRLRWRDSLDGLDAARLRELGAKYDADYAITDVAQSPVPLQVVHREGPYVIYRLR